MIFKLCDQMKSLETRRGTSHHMLYFLGGKSFLPSLRLQCKIGCFYDIFQFSILGQCRNGNCLPPEAPATLLPLCLCSKLIVSARSNVQQLLMHEATNVIGHICFHFPFQCVGINCKWHFNQYNPIMKHHYVSLDLRRQE